MSNKSILAAESETDEVPSYIFSLVYLTIHPLILLPCMTRWIPVAFVIMVFHEVLVLVPNTWQ